MSRGMTLVLLSTLLMPALLLFGCATRDHTAAATAATDRALASDLDMLSGPMWRGTLTYLDYGSGKRTSIPSTLLVEKRPPTPEGPCWSVAFGYTDEPQANSAEELVLREKGRMLGTERVIERADLSDGSIRLITEEAGEDDGRSALFRRVYTLGPRSCTIQKLVKPEGAAELFERNVYSWTR